MTDKPRPSKFTWKADDIVVTKKAKPQTPPPVAAEPKKK
jgi:hypothetical protein